MHCYTPRNGKIRLDTDKSLGQKCWPSPKSRLTFHFRSPHSTAIQKSHSPCAQRRSPNSPSVLLAAPPKQIGLFLFCFFMSPLETYRARTTQLESGKISCGKNGTVFLSRYHWMVEKKEIPFLRFSLSLRYHVLMVRTVRCHEKSGVFVYVINKRFISLVK